MTKNARRNLELSTAATIVISFAAGATTSTMMFLAIPFFLSLLVGVGFAQTEQLIRSLPTNKFYINGTWVDPILPDEDEAFVYIEESDDNSLFFKVIDPSTAKIVARVATAGVPFPFEGCGVIHHAGLQEIGR